MNREMHSADLIGSTLPALPYPTCPALPALPYPTCPTLPALVLRSFDAALDSDLDPWIDFSVTMLDSDSNGDKMAARLETDFRC